MKTIQQVKTLLRVTILGAVLALGFSSSAEAAWNENTVTGGIAAEAPSSLSGAYDPGYGIFWCTANSKLYAVYWNGSAWTSTQWAANCASGNFNTIAVDNVNHWVFYRGTDQAIWVCYYTGATWATAKVGTSLVNNPRQLCVDSGYHVLWYLDGSGYLWAVYHNGSAWVEVLIDGVNQRSINNRSCGVDEVYHFVWHTTSTQDNLRYSYHNGSAWVSTTTGTLIGGAKYNTLCVDGPTHQIYCLISAATNVPTRLLSRYYTGSGWAFWNAFEDGNLPILASPSHYCIPSPNSYSCILGGAYDGAYAKVLFTNYSANARNWTTCRQDNNNQGGSTGLFPLAAGHGGRSVLCRNGNGAVGCKVLYSDLP